MAPRNILSFFLLTWLWYLCSSSLVIASDKMIYAVIVGVSNYEEGNLKHAATGATIFHKRILETYGADNIDYKLLLNGDAKEDAVRDALSEVSQLREGALFIFYFAGHGQRGNKGKDPLYLCLSETNSKNYKSKSITERDLTDSLSANRSITAMMFLDCCFSGARPSRIKFTEDEMRYLGHRAFMIASSSNREISEKGLFTKALEHVFTNVEVPCLSPLVIEKEVQRQLRPHTEFMSAQLAFDTAVRRCFPKLGERSCHLIVSFSNHINRVLDISYQTSEGTEKDFDQFTYIQNQNMVYARQIEAKPVKIVIKSQGQIIHESTLNTNHLLKGYHHIIIEPPRWLADSQTTSARDKSNANLELSRIMEHTTASDQDLLAQYTLSAELALNSANQDAIAESLLGVTKYAQVSEITRYAQHFPQQQLIEGAIRNQNWQALYELTEGILAEKSYESKDRGYILYGTMLANLAKGNENASLPELMEKYELTDSITLKLHQAELAALLYQADQETLDTYEVFPQTRQEWENSRHPWRSQIPAEAITYTAINQSDDTITIHKNHTPRSVNRTTGSPDYVTIDVTPEVAPEIEETNRGLIERMRLLKLLDSREMAAPPSN